MQLVAINWHIYLITHSALALGMVGAFDGERLTLVWWQDEETLAAWRTDARHLVAQRAGRERWYEYYRLEVAEVKRSAHFDRPSV